MNGWRKGTALWSAAIAVCSVAVSCLPAMLAAQRTQSSRPAPRPQAAPQGRGSAPGQPQHQHYPGPPYLGPNGARPAYPGYPRPINAPPGHLQSWLNSHRNLPVAKQEQLLRGDPTFRRLTPGEQQRLIRQLQDVDRLSDQQRQRRLQRAENLERLSPEERMAVNRSAREWTTLPPDQQARMKRAFRDLRAVPPDQRATVLNSQQYRDRFSEQQRGILSELLKIEPYEPAAN